MSDTRGRYFPHFLTTKPFVAMLPQALAALLTQVASGKRPAQYAPSAKAAADMRNGRSSAKRTVLIPILDTLTLSEGWYGTTYQEIGDAIDRAAADSDVDRVILYIDSPGGEVTGLPETAAQIAALAKQKQVTAVVADIAASAAYWLASQANNIVLTPSGQVGSVGVRMMHVDFSKNLEQAGVKVTELFAGDFKTEWTPYSALTDAAKADAQKQLDSIYSQFIKAVRNGRGNRASKAALDNRFGNGRILSSEDALRAGMVDVIQSPRDFFNKLAANPGAIQLAAARAQIERLRVL